MAGILTPQVEPVCDVALGEQTAKPARRFDVAAFEGALPADQIEMHRAGDLYDLRASSEGVAKPVGQWNTAIIRLDDDHITHWLNGHKIVEITRGTPEWDRAIAASKFEGVEGFGRAKRGHLALQDHGDIVWYRNIKVRELPPGS